MRYYHQLTRTKFIPEQYYTDLYRLINTKKKIKPSDKERKKIQKSKLYIIDIIDIIDLI